jgi:DNA polymerase III epsilon subunit family exonuclease
MELNQLNADFIAFDLETTGLVAAIDRVVEVGAVRFTRSGRELDRFQELVHPGRPMPLTAQSIHGISDEDLAGARPAREVLPGFLRFLGDPRTTSLVAHNAAFDAGFLGSELRRCGFPLPSFRVLDTLALARRRRPDLSSHRLDRLATTFRLNQGTTHRALADSLCVMRLWLALDGPSAATEELVSFPIQDPRDGAAAPHGWEVLDEAMVHGWSVRIEYAGGTRGNSLRPITPRSYSQRGGETYVLAYCHLDAIEKSFRLDRIRACTLERPATAGRVDPDAVSR